MRRGTLPPKPPTSGTPAEIDSPPPARCRLPSSVLWRGAQQRVTSIDFEPSKRGHRTCCRQHRRRAPRLNSHWIFSLVITARRERNTTRQLPKFERNRHWIDPGFVPPRWLVTMTVKLTMVEATQGHGELVRNSTPKGTRLSVAKWCASQGCRPHTVQG